MPRLIERPTVIAAGNKPKQIEEFAGRVNSGHAHHLRIQLEDGELQLGRGQLAVVPRTVRHRPIAIEECWVMLIETVTTTHTGDVVSPLTRSIAEQLR